MLEIDLDAMIDDLEKGLNPIEPYTICLLKSLIIGN